MIGRPQNKSECVWLWSKVDAKGNFWTLAESTDSAGNHFPSHFFFLFFTFKSGDFGWLFAGETLRFLFSAPVQIFLTVLLLLHLLLRILFVCVFAVFWRIIIYNLERHCAEANFDFAKAGSRVCACSIEVYQELCLNWQLWIAFSKVKDSYFHTSKQCKFSKNRALKASVWTFNESCHYWMIYISRKSNCVRIEKKLMWKYPLHIVEVV